MGKLVVFLPDGTTKAIGLGKERMVIGRRPDNDLCLPYPAVSGEHAAVVTILEDSFLEDLNSTNGTLVNGASVQKHFLRDRDQIDIGRQKLVYLSDEAAQVEADGLQALRRDLGASVAKADRAALTLDDLLDDVEIELPREIERSTPVAEAPAASGAKPEASRPSQADAPLPAASESASPDNTKRIPGANAKSSPEPARPTPTKDDTPRAAKALRADATRESPPATRTRVDAPAKRDAPASASAANTATNGKPFNTLAEAVASKESRSQQASNDRGLARMARIRSGGPTKDDATGGSNGGSRIDTVLERLAEPSTSPPAESRVALARITVLSGPNAGRSLIIERDEVVVGRVGVQVAAIDRRAGGFRLQLREGEMAPLLNGEPLAVGGAALKSGDVFEVAGARLEFIAPK